MTLADSPETTARKFEGMEEPESKMANLVTTTTHARSNDSLPFLAQTPMGADELNGITEFSPDSEEDPPEGAPPGLKEPKVKATVELIMTPGSMLHGTGECRPCAWFHKEKGCQNGSDCRHCHICPEGEVKMRRKTKVDGLRMGRSESEMSQVNSATSERKELKVEKLASVTSPIAESSLSAQDDAFGPPPGLLVVPKVLREPELSQGSALHGTGLCRPCAWFHKTAGCENAEDCRHCHMCPEGEIKSRRKLKATNTKDSDGLQQKSCSLESLDDTSPRNGDSEEASPVMLPFASKAREAKGYTDGDKKLPSPGSAFHASGDCRPCAWFHKPQGCENAEQCRHCHLCPKGEIRDRRKSKVAVLKEAGGGLDTDIEQALWVVQKQQEALLVAQWQAQAMWEVAAVASMQAEFAFAAAAAATAASPMQLKSPASFRKVEAPSPMKPAFLTAPDGQTSAGSNLHGTGMCRPCAWFWKAQGCQNGAACAHCHLCPEGELRERKRMKEASMRTAGGEPMRVGRVSSDGTALSDSPTSAPTGSPAGDRSLQVVKIASVLGP